MELIASLKGHSDRVWSVSWSPCGKLLASCGADRTIRLWELGNDEIWECAAVLEDTQSRTIRCVTFSSCGNWLAAGSFDATTVIWRKTKHGEWVVLSTLEGHENEVKSVAIGHGFIATCSRDKTIWLYEDPGEISKIPDDEEIDMDCVSVMTGHSQDVKSVKWHPLKPLLFSASYDDTIRVWIEHVDDWSCAAVLSGHSNTVWDIAIDAKTDRVVSCSQDKSMRIWDNQTGKWECAKVFLDLHERTIFSVDWCSNGKRIASCGGDDAIVIIGGAEDTNTMRIEHRKVHAHDADVNCVRWNPVETEYLASAGDDETVNIWKVVM